MSIENPFDDPEWKRRRQEDEEFWDRWERREFSPCWECEFYGACIVLGMLAVFVLWLVRII